MGYQRELSGIESFINDFDPEEFSSDKADIKRLDENVKIENAKRFKARLQRKKRLKQKFSTIEFHNQYDTTDVMITQEQIDALLNEKE